MDILYGTTNKIVGTPEDYIPRATIIRIEDGAPLRVTSSPFDLLDANYANVDYTSTVTNFLVSVQDALNSSGYSLNNWTPSVATLVG